MFENKAHKFRTSSSLMPAKHSSAIISAIITGTSVFSFPEVMQLCENRGSGAGEGQEGKKANGVLTVRNSSKSTEG